jgi:hypoxanthine-DNA glycosylase
MLLTGLPPVVGGEPRVLVLGSMPSERSLRDERYYAQPSNRFWRLMADIVGVPSDAPYAARTAALGAHGVALWDVLKHCLRAGSLDSAIVRTTEIPNEVGPFLERHGGVRRVLLNGRTAERAFHEHVAPTLPGGVLARVETVALPSTSAANARWRYPALAEAWRAAFADAPDRGDGG